MKTTLTALTTLGACTAARWYLERPDRPDRAYADGCIKIRALWNDGAGFGLHVSRSAVEVASVAVLGMIWAQRRKFPAAAGLVMGGGLSNLYERLRMGSVYDYVQFPKAPGKWRRYVFNLADFAIVAGAAGMALRKK